MAGERTEHGMETLVSHIRGIRIGMVTLPDSAGVLSGRPLVIQEEDFDGSLWFLVSRSAEWTGGVTGDTQANVALVYTNHATWISLSGTASLVDDADRIASMWGDTYASWFTGPDDPDLTLLHFRATTAEYWDAKTNEIVRHADLG